VKSEVTSRRSVTFSSTNFRIARSYWLTPYTSVAASLAACNFRIPRSYSLTPRWLHPWLSARRPSLPRPSSAEQHHLIIIILYHIKHHYDYSMLRYTHIFFFNILLASFITMFFIFFSLLRFVIFAVMF
jgi:hypothetical protein